MTKGDTDLRETGLNALMKMALRFIMMLVSAVTGYQIAILFQPTWIVELIHFNAWMALCLIICVVVGYFVSPVVWWMLKKIGFIFENILQNVSIKDVIAAVVGLLIGLLIANLIAIPFRDVSGIGFYIAIALNIIFAFIGVTAFLKKRDELWAFGSTVFARGGRASSKREKAAAKDRGDSTASVDRTRSYKKVFDTSALIDGRVLDIAKTGFLEGTFVVPRFVLTELQGVADSQDPVKRARGRKGLSVISDLQKISGIAVEIQDIATKELARDKVDEALIVLCKNIDAKIITTDYNLNQISQIEGVDVLNINDLANSLKPQFIPGDIVVIDIIRAGKERGQGVGYLDDGTMLVIEDGEEHIGETVSVSISSMLQTAAGRMVFGKVKR